MQHELFLSFRTAISSITILNETFKFTLIYVCGYWKIYSLALWWIWWHFHFRNMMIINLKSNYGKQKWKNEVLNIKRYTEKSEKTFEIHSPEKQLTFRRKNNSNHFTLMKQFNEKWYTNDLNGISQMKAYRRVISLYQKKLMLLINKFKL